RRARGARIHAAARFPAGAGRVRCGILEGAPVTPRSVPFRLGVMMFLQYAVWGAWLPTAASYLKDHLHFESAQIGMILGLAGSIGAVASPFIAGQFADRYFNPERFLAV